MPTPPAVLTLAAVLAYLHERKKRGEINDRTRRNQYHVLTHFATVLGNPSIDRVTRRHVERWQEALEVSDRTHRNYFITVRTFLRYAHDRGWIPVDPTHGMRAPKVHRSVPRQLTGDEVAALYEACRHSRDRLLLTLMLQEGCRCVEVARLSWDDIDPHNKTVILRGKGGNERVLPLTTAAVHAIEAYHLDVRVMRTGPVVRSLTDPRSGIKAETVSLEMSELFARAGVRKFAWDGKSAHAARHTCAGDVLRRGAHVRDVQQMLGHQSLETTQRYLPLLVNNLRDTMEGRHYGTS
jgi:integrase/recombinase XerD